MRSPTWSTVTLCTSRTARTVSAARVRAVADAGLVLARLDVDDDVALRAARAARPPPPRRRPRAPGRPPRPARRAMTTSAKWRPAAWRIRRRRTSTGGSIRRDRVHRRLGRLGRRAVHEHVDVPAHQPDRGEEDETRDEQRRQRVAVRVAAARPPRARRGPRPSRAGRRRSGARSPAAPRFRSAGPSAARRLVRPASISDHDREHEERPPRGVDVRLEDPGQARERERGDDEARDDEDRRPRASAARCSAFPWPYWCPGSAGRTATPTAKKVSSAATRSVPECSASETRPRRAAREAGRELEQRPARAAATTDTSAVRRCGCIGAGYARSSRQRTTSCRAEKWASGASSGRSIPSGVIVFRSSSSSAAWSGHGGWWISARCSAPRCPA